MSFLNKRVEDSIKQAKLLAQMSELSYRALNGTRQTRSNFINNDLKEQADTDKPAVGSLTSEMIAQYKREEEDLGDFDQITMTLEEGESDQDEETIVFGLI